LEGRPTGRRQLRAYPGALGRHSPDAVDAETFDSTFESFAVYTKLQRADELARRYRISSVPTIIVNGKYTTSATMAGSYPVLLEVIDELIAMERAGE
jgi:thiol:disulfide interchange protein DsbA